MPPLSAAERTALLSCSEAAQLLNISEWLLRKEIQRTSAVLGVPVVRIGRRVLIPRHGLERALNRAAVADDG